VKIAIFGSGGVGGYFGARLAAAGQEVHFIARGRHLAAMREQGLKVTSALGNAHLRPVHATDQPAEIGPVDIVTFAVKLWDTDAAAEQLRPLVAKGGHVIPFQNGVESIDRLRKVLPEESVMGGSAYIGTRISAPGVIEHTGTMARLRFGPVLPSQRPAAERFLSACQQAGIMAELVEDIVLVNWEKFVFLVAMSSATAVARAPLGVIRGDPELRWLFEQAMRETWRLGRAKGVKLPKLYDPDVVEMAKKCQDPSKDIWGFGQTLNRSDDGNGYMNNILLDYGGGVWDKDGKPALGTSFLKQNLAALQFSVDTIQKHKIQPPGVMSWTDVHNNEAFIAGKLVSTNNGASLYYGLVSKKNPIAEKTLVIQTPGGNVTEVQRRGKGASSARSAPCPGRICGPAWRSTPGSVATFPLMGILLSCSPHPEVEE
jgi:2-dehydropantoate 2-reductase